MSSHIKVPQGRAPANAVGIVARHGSDARGVGVIVIRTQGKPQRLASLVKRSLVRQPFVRLKTPGNDRTSGAMKLVMAEIGVAFDLAEELEAMLVVPLIVAHRRPRVVIFGNAAQKDLTVDGARPAGHLASRHQHGWRFVSPTPRKLPVVIADHDVGGRDIAVFELTWQVVDVRVIRPRLQE